MTNSVAADGQTTLTGALKGYAGSVGSPGYSFASDSNCGFYRIAADNIGASCAGAKVLDISATGLGVTGALTVSTTIGITGVSTFSAALRADAGSAAAPSYSFTGDTNSGWYSASADVLAASVAGSDAVYVGTTGFTVVADLAAVNATFSGAMSAASIAGTAVATQSDQETATSTSTAVSPGRQHFHPSASKCWLKCDHAGNVNASYNITSITDTGPGVVTVTIATDFSSAHYALNVSVGTAVGVCAPNSSQAAGSFVINAFNTGTGAAQDSILGYYAEAHGDI
jgi:hypothetical protein